MSDFDLTTMQLEEPEAIAPEDYTPPYNDNTPVDKGTYVAKLIDAKFKPLEGAGPVTPIRIGSVKSKQNGKSFLSAELAIELPEATVAGKPSTDRRVYTRVNTMPEYLIFKQVKAGRANANGFLDMLVAAGWDKSIRSNNDYVEALLTLIAQNAGVKARIDKEAYCNPNSREYAGCGATIRGEDSFLGVTNESGEVVDVGLRTLCPGDHPSGAPILLARNVVKAFYPLKKR